MTKPLVRHAIKTTVVVQYFRIAGVLAGFKIKKLAGIAVLPLRMDLTLIIKWSSRYHRAASDTEQTL